MEYGTTMNVRAKEAEDVARRRGMEFCPYGTPLEESWNTGIEL
jgi:hypothetical protein